jgi:hypothetical protein
LISQSRGLGDVYKRQLYSQSGLLSNAHGSDVPQLEQK